MPSLTDRADAGRRLAQRLLASRGRDVVVLALPRGGVREALTRFAESLADRSS